ncbi:general odorant-binding protein 56d-like [Choristoneura fumiferana]|uniref:general odorant-binding protein 56d-like n=1 Tax=Choristoneura fumiferana TaxID=7141 RepID=UPI003D15D30B
MRTFIVLLAVLAVAYAKNVQLSQTQKEKVQQHTVECMKQSGVKPELLAEAKKGNFKDDESLKKFTFCFFQKAGILNNDGKLNVDVALSKLPQGADKAGVKKALEQCSAKKGRDAADTAFEVFKCYYRATPTHVVF